MEDDSVSSEYSQDGNDFISNDGEDMHVIPQSRYSEESPLILDLMKKSSGERFFIDLSGQAAEIEQRPQVHHKKLREWPATAICGNDITSSCLYVIGVSTGVAGVWSPIGLLFVAFILYLYRNIYAEVGSALPLNGASYTLLLNTTTKMVSGLAACLTLISYTATAVVSAYSAVLYFENIYKVPVVPCVLGLLLFFAILTIMGITESSVVALIIFVVHLGTLAILEVCAVIYVVKHPHIIVDNWYAPQPNDVASALFFGFGAGMLGITGFETSANFIEEQGKGVFPKTLRNMWVIVAYLNPTLALLSIMTMPMEVILANSGSVLAQMGLTVVDGRWLGILVAADAFLVLSGGVLTSYVGVNGLIRRMSLDRLLPKYFLKTNKLRGTTHWITLTFLGLCSSLFMVLFFSYGDDALNSLAGVYTIAFLSVMTLFALGDYILKYKRRRIPREFRAVKFSIFVASGGCIAALIANILMAPHNLSWFTVYYSLTATLVLLMYFRVKILKLVIHSIPKGRFTKKLISKLIAHTYDINHQSLIFFTSSDKISHLNKAVLYVRDNEITNNLKIVHIYTEENPQLQTIVDNVKTLDSIYPKMKIDFVGIKGTFGPAMLEAISSHFDIPKNMMFISCPSSQFSEKVDTLGGVRIITTTD